MSQPTAIVISTGDEAAALRSLIDRLANAGVAVSVVDDLDDARLIASRCDPAAPPVVFIHVPEATADNDDVIVAARRIKIVREALPALDPVAVTYNAAAALVLALFRAGAGDVVDVVHEGTTQARVVVGRVGARQAARAASASAAASLREMVEELLRDLVRTERRSIDLEERLARRERRSTGEMVASADSNPDRQPTVVIVEDDREVADVLAEELELAGVSTFAFLTGEAAVLEVGRLIQSGTWFDLALVDMRLPGIDGIETIRRLRGARPGLSGFLMTGFHDPSTAATAADLGVVGFVRKPFDDLAQLVTRVRALAFESMQRHREQLYLRRIKERHERVLLQYRKLAAETE